MANFLQYLISGISMGSLYVLVAMGIVLIYRSTRILNFAHGDMATMGTFCMFTLLLFKVPFSLAFVLSILAGGLLAIAFYFVVIVPAQRRDATILGQITLTVGLSMIIQGGILLLWGTDSKVLDFPLSDIKIWKIGPLYVNELSLGTLAIGLIGSYILYLLIQKTRIGLAMRATSENLPAAQTLGIPTRMVLGVSWGLAAVLGVLAGLFLAPSLLLDPFFMLEPFLKGFAGAILGGLNSLPGAIIGGLIIGVVESFTGGYIALEFKNTIAFVIIILVLLVKPEGLLGKVFKERV
ncbi:MAG TPA: branched-chain amino acid ABC transporter permease [Deltaproteobacteria bacterium]|nr:branched-chain amino acid ABC transporter permease [Deltaproteobacteria bacterium]